MDDELDNLVGVEIVGIDDDRVWRRPQRGDGSFGVDTISCLHLSPHRFGVDALSAPLELSRTASHLLIEARGQEEFVVRVWKHDGPDVSARHHDAIARRLSLLLDQGLAHPWDGGYPRQRLREVGVVDAVREV